LSVRERGLLWAFSIGICPIASLLLLSYAPVAPGSDARGFALFVALVGVGFGLATGIFLSKLVARPIDELNAAARDVAAGKFDRRIQAARPDEFGQLLAAFDHMLEQLREKERLRQTFGLHVGRAAAEQILTRDPGLGGSEQVITVMFVDIRGFTARSSVAPAPEIVTELNEFLRAMVHVVEERNGGMINKFLGDGFMALFGVAGEESHAHAAVRAAGDMLETLEELNARIVQRGREPLRIGVGIHTGPAVVGSIGSPQRLEFTAVGSTVNLAARIEQLTKELRAVVLLTEATARCLPRSEQLVALEPQAIRGMDDRIAIFTTSPRERAPAATQV
jgi:adenylate cyclase